MKELVFIQNEQVLTTSLKVAAKFEKPHNDVLKAVRKLAEEIEGVGKISQSPLFVESTYTNQQNKEQPMYYMNFDGFTLLAMGFTGERALKFKLEYIAAFNAMKKELSERANVTMQDISLKLALVKPYEVIDDIGATRDSIMRTFGGVKDGIALAQAINLNETYYGRDLQDLKVLLPPAEHQTGFMNPTQIGKEITALTGVEMKAKAVNQKLKELGLQTKPNKDWRLTDEGKKYAEEYPFEKNGHAGYHIQWNEEIVQVLLEAQAH